MRLLQSVPFAIIMGIASNNALFNVGHDEGVHKVPNTLGLLVAISSWTQLLSADAIFTNVAARAPCYCTVLKCQAERLCWLPGPPVASFQLAAKCMAALCIILLTEVHRKVLTLSIHVALP